MTGIRPEQLARRGEFYLQEAVLDVLLEAKREKECMGAAEISRRSGIFREKGIAGLNDAIVTGLLNKLEKEGSVEKCGEQWELTDQEFTRRDAVS